MSTEELEFTVVVQAIIDEDDLHEEDQGVPGGTSSTFRRRRPSMTRKLWAAWRDRAALS